MIWILAAIGGMAVIVGAWFAILVVARAMRLKRFGCLFGVHDWTPWWVYAPGGREPAALARGVQKGCMKCGLKRYEPAGYPFSEDGWVKPEWDVDGYYKTEEEPTP